LQKVFAGKPVDELDAGGAASDLTECADLEGWVRLPPDDLTGNARLPRRPT
jgi:hypothetical protein